MSKNLHTAVDDTEDRVHGGQQLSLWNAHYDSRCFSTDPHSYEATAGKPVAVILRPGKTPYVSSAASGRADRR